MICTFFLTHPLLGQPANLHTWSLCLSEALRRWPQELLLPYCVGAATSYPEPPTLGLPNFPVSAPRRWAQSRLLSGWLWDVLQSSAGKTKMQQEKPLLRGSCQRFPLPFLLWERRGVRHSLSMSFCSCHHWVGFSVYSVSRWHTLPFWPSGSCLEQHYPDA